MYGAVEYRVISSGGLRTHSRESLVLGGILAFNSQADSFWSLSAAMDPLLELRIDSEVLATLTTNTGETLSAVGPPQHRCGRPGARCIAR